MRFENSINGFYVLHHDGAAAAILVVAVVARRKIRARSAASMVLGSGLPTKSKHIVNKRYN